MRTNEEIIKDIKSVLDKNVKDNVAIAACERTGTRYTVIGKEDLVIPPPPKNDRV